MNPTTHRQKAEIIADRIFPGRDRSLSCKENSCNAVCHGSGKCILLEKSENQLDYVLFPSSTDLFLSACPGSGKTEVVGLKAAYEFHGWEDAASGIAILTFTNNAADVIRKRVQQYAGAENSGYPHFIGTFDSWLHRYLAHPYGHLVTGFVGKQFLTSRDKSIRLVDENEREGWLQQFRCRTDKFNLDYHSESKSGGKQTPLYANMIHWSPEKNEWKIKLPLGNKYIAANEYFDSEAFSKFRSTNAWYSVTPEEMKNGFRNSKARFEHNGFATYKDAEWISLRLLNQREELRNRLALRFPFVIVDECQDLSWIQLQLLGVLRRGGATLHFVGDLNQAIYEFKEVDPTLISEFVKAQSFEKKELKRNFRSYQPIVDICSKIVNSEAVVGNLASDEPACVCFAFNGPDDLVALVSRFEKFLIERGFEPRKSVILARGNGLVKRIQSLPDQSPKNSVLKLATAIHLWTVPEVSWRPESLKLTGEFISSRFNQGRSGSSRYFCPHILNSSMKWRFFLAKILNVLSLDISEVGDLNQPIEAWTHLVRTHLNEVIVSVLPILDDPLAEASLSFAQLSGNNFKTPQTQRVSWYLN